ncbi:hypothetical protein SNEBB_000028 [Seison nebaliae]|nr:hypothetical protein SNEBB_000028 [Seison nebaliae]
MVLVFIALLTILIVLASFIYLRDQPSNIPPKAPSLKWYLPAFIQLFFYRDEFLKKCSETNEPLLMVNLGIKQAVIINKASTARDIFGDLGENTSDRPHAYPLKILVDGKGLIARDYTEDFRRLRKFVMKILKDMGIGDDILEERVINEVQYIEQYLRNQISDNTNKKLIDFVQLTNNASANIICNIIFGKRYSHDDSEFSGLMTQFKNIVLNFNPTQLWKLNPIAIRIPGTSMNRISNSAKTLKKFIHGEIQEHIRTYDENNIRDAIDEYIRQTQNGLLVLKDNKSRQEQDVDFLATILNIFGAGTQTVAHSLGWAMFFISRNLSIQQKCSEEIKRNIGDNFVKFSDIKLLPYCHATILEIFRLSSVAPLGIFHRAHKDVVYKNYVIPKNTIIFMNIFGVHHSSNTWGDDCDDFRPERFLRDDGTIEYRNELIPFSVGKRSCAGEHLARMEFMLFFCNIVRSFDVQLPDNHETILKNQEGLVRMSPYTHFNVSLKSN